MSTVALIMILSSMMWLVIDNLKDKIWGGKSYSSYITISSVLLILLATSMAAWYIVRVNNRFTKLIYYLCIFSMVVPFQMVMFTLSKTADTLFLNNPFTISILYLGFGAGMAIFLFSGFMKSIPIEIEEAAAIDGCNPVQMFFKVIMPICKPIYISVAILEIMWIWNDYLLPYLTLDRTRFRTIPIHIQYLQGSYGTVDLGATMAIIMLTLIPIIIIYILFQKHIIKGVVDGAVK
jgi:raffinose/stachyose/melibiose transport system permease protein